MTENQAIKIVENPLNPKNQIEIALLVLSHSGRAKAIKAIENFIAINKNSDLDFWAKTAYEECIYFRDW
jgi:hypothetical protein